MNDEETVTQVEYRLGWVQRDGRWRPFTSLGTQSTKEEAEAGISYVKERMTSSTKDVRDAIQNNRIEVRTRIVTYTVWTAV